MRISDWSSDVCSSDLLERATEGALLGVAELKRDLVQRAATPLQRVLGELDTLLLHDIGELHAHACQSLLQRPRGGAQFLDAAIHRTVSIAKPLAPHLTFQNRTSGGYGQRVSISV